MPTFSVYSSELYSQFNKTETVGNLENLIFMTNNLVGCYFCNLELILQPQIYQKFNWNGVSLSRKQ